MNMISTFGFRQLLFVGMAAQFMIHHAHADNVFEHNAQHWLAASLVTVKAVPNSISNTTLETMATEFMDSYNALALSNCAGTDRLEIASAVIVDSNRLQGIAAMIEPNDPAADDVQEFSYVMELELTSIYNDDGCVDPDADTPLMFLAAADRRQRHLRDGSARALEACSVCIGSTKQDFLNSYRQALSGVTVDIEAVTQITYHEGCTDNEVTEFHLLLAIELDPTGATPADMADPIQRAAFERSLVASHNEANELNRGICDLGQHRFTDASMVSDDTRRQLHDTDRQVHDTGRQLQSPTSPPTLDLSWFNGITNLYFFATGSCTRCGGGFGYYADLRRRLEDAASLSTSCFCAMDLDDNGSDGVHFGVPTVNDTLQILQRLEVNTGVVVADMFENVEVPCSSSANASDFVAVMSIANVELPPGTGNSSLGVIEDCIPTVYRKLQAKNTCDSLFRNVLTATVLSLEETQAGMYTVDLDFVARCHGCDPYDTAVLDESNGSRRKLDKQDENKDAAISNAGVVPSELTERQLIMDDGECYCNAATVNEDRAPTTDEFIAGLKSCVSQAMV